MRRFFVEKAQDPFVLRGESHKHLAVVLRARVGEEVTLCCGDGFDYVCRIESVHADQTVLSLIDKRASAGEPSVRVTLFMSVLKGDKNEFVVQKATELGVEEIVPVFTRFVQAHSRDCKIDRLRKIACEAAQQCGRGRLPKVQDAVSFAAMRERLADFQAVVFPYEKATELSLRDFLRGRAENVPATAAVIIGSEGGFADEEAAALQQSGVTPVTLGKRILRAETANLAVLSALMYEWGQWA